MDIREAKGAEVCGSRVASGSQGAEAAQCQYTCANSAMRACSWFQGLMPCGGASCLGSLALVSALLLPSAALALSAADVDGGYLRSGLLTLDTIVSRVVTVCFSVRRSRSSVDLVLFVRVLPDNVLFCAGRSGPDAGEFALGLAWVLDSN